MACRVESRRDTSNNRRLHLAKTGFRKKVTGPFSGLNIIASVTTYCFLDKAIEILNAKYLFKCSYYHIDGNSIYFDCPFEILQLCVKALNEYENTISSGRRYNYVVSTQEYLEMIGIGIGIVSDDLKHVYNPDEGTIWISDVIMQ